jgi:Ni/Fe-hydrogenase 1 B-type cytochrome subunit
VWEWAVRFFHWINALSIVLLALTGYLIGEPSEVYVSAEAYQQYWFGTVRFIHFASAYVFTFNLLFRLYWGFVGNRFAKWNNFIPHKAEQFKEVTEVLKVDILQFDPKSHINLGHNSLAAFIYFIVMMASLFQVLSGFTLYVEMSSIEVPRLLAGFTAFVVMAIVWRSLMDKGKSQAVSLAAGLLSLLGLYYLLKWLIPGLMVLLSSILGGEAGIRQWHHILMWVFIVFTIAHVYLAFYHDYVEGRGTVSSMVGGWKFFKGDVKDISKQK